MKGSLVLVGGAPGIGKSTLMLHICDNLCRFASVLYVSGEESERQIKLRAERLHVRGEGMYLLAETNLEDVLESVNELKPTDVLIVDSIQTLYNGDLTTAPGSVGQVKDCTMALMQLAKGQGITVFVIGHVNKEGSIAGPKVLEHMVDCVLYFEGEQQNSYRILRAAKNRFGATNEIGVFEMEDSGLSEVPNPWKCCSRDGLRTPLAPASPASWRECGLFWPRYRPCWRPPASMYRAGPPTASTSTGQICCWLFWKSGAD